MPHDEITPEEAWSRLLDAMPPWARRLASMAGDGDAWEDFTRQVAGEQQPFWKGADPQEMIRSLLQGSKGGWSGPGPWGRSTVRAGRGDVRSAILVLLGEEPMHGYQLMQEMSQRSDGAWRPSPGSVYPTLSVMEEEGLVSAEQTDGRKVFSLTTEGRVAAAAEDGAQPPWEAVNERAREADDVAADDETPMTPPPAAPDQTTDTAHGEALTELRNAVNALLRTEDDGKADAALEVLVEARRSIYRLLAEG